MDSVEDIKELLRKDLDRWLIVISKSDRFLDFKLQLTLALVELLQETYGRQSKLFFAKMLRMNRTTFVEMYRRLD